MKMSDTTWAAPALNAEKTSDAFCLKFAKEKEFEPSGTWEISRLTLGQESVSSRQTSGAPKDTTALRKFESDYIKYSCVALAEGKAADGLLSRTYMCRYVCLSVFQKKRTSVATGYIDFKPGNNESTWKYNLCQCHLHERALVRWPNQIKPESTIPSEREKIFGVKLRVCHFSAERNKWL